MQCPKCQTENREGMRFCEQCGAKMELQCPNCKATIPLGKKFCGECGAEIKELGVRRLAARESLHKSGDPCIMRRS